MFFWQKIWIVNCSSLFRTEWTIYLTISILMFYWILGVCQNMKRLVVFWSCENSDKNSSVGIKQLCILEDFLISNYVLSIHLILGNICTSCMLPELGSMGHSITCSINLLNAKIILSQTDKEHCYFSSEKLPWRDSFATGRNLVLPFENVITTTIKEED